MSYKKKLHKKVRTGDIIGISRWFSNPLFNFIYLWIMKDLKYARGNWTKIVPHKFYVVCKGRMNNLLYGAVVKGNKKKNDIHFKALHKLGRVVFIGRSKNFDSLSAHMDLNAKINSLHYFFIAEKGHLLFLDNKRNMEFALYSLSVGGYDKLKSIFNLNPITFIELGKLDVVPHKN